MYMLFSRLMSQRWQMVVILVVALHAVVTAQLKPAVGIRQNTPDVHALVNVRIITSPGKVIDKGTLVMRDGIITAVGAKAVVPADARVWDFAGMTVYPGLIDAYSDFGMPKKPKSVPGSGDTPKPSEPARGGRHWNENVNAAISADELFVPDASAAEKMRSMGVTSAFVVPQKGIFRGTSAVYNLSDGTPNQLLVQPDVAQCVTFETDNGDGYPGSLMGTIALIRQTMFDARWYRDAMSASAKYPDEPKVEFSADLAALENIVSRKQPIIFESTDEFSLLRAAKIAKEFSLNSMVRGSGSEYRRIEAVKETGLPIILPVNFPETPSVQSPEDALSVSLQEMRYWDEAPENPKKLQEAGIVFAFTSATLKDAGSFLGNIRKAVERGLSPNAALAALTTTPARLFGVDKKLGSLEAGKMANIVIADGDLFSEKTKIRETWVEGKRFEVKAKSETDPRGTWQAVLNGAPVDSISIALKGEVDGLQATGKVKGKEVKFTTSNYGDLRLALAFDGDSVGMNGVIRMSATYGGDAFIGTGELSDGRMFSWKATRSEPFKAEADTSKPKVVTMASYPPVYPPGEFGRPKQPVQPVRIFINNATVWTQGTQGRIEHGDVLIEKGKIVRVGTDLTAPADALVIDGTGKHVTPGMIDCHSHTGVAGSVNEAGEAITAEVRIGDVLDPDDIGIYRELAGGLTSSNVLHGSANAIGGQNQVVKLRWGSLPEQMKFEGAMPGIKFALGENPKQSNWGEKFTTRYPQTRGGVEQIIRDEFQSALDYERTWKEFSDGKSRIRPRRDLQAEAVLEIVKGTRLVHSHSYRQDEIEMLLRVTEHYGVRIATFQHVLEGYKVADQIAKHGAGASTFSDWWAFKFEVYDAVPYNGAIMHDQGVVVSFNSDSDELARRMNLEAAKAVKYGGLSEVEALKFVTINPAKQLRIDHRVGSLETGKDADFVVWSGNPLSTYSMCEQTWIDGRKYFDRTEDRAMNEEVQRERSVLVQKALVAKKGGGGTSASKGEKLGHSCHEEFFGKER